MKFRYVIAICSLIVGCTSNNSDISLNDTTQNIPATKTMAAQNIDLPKASILKDFLSENEIANLLQIKNVFDSRLCTNPDNTITYCYKMHANMMAADLFNEIPYTLNFPYDDSFDLSMIAGNVDALSFLTKKCGFQNEQTNEVIHFYCLKNKGSYMDFQKKVGETNSMIAFLQEDYVDNKAITPNARQRISISAQGELDFSNIDHQLVYMLFHLMVNEERIAYNKVTPKST